MNASFDASRATKAWFIFNLWHCVFSVLAMHLKDMRECMGIHLEVQGSHSYPVDQCFRQMCPQIFPFWKEEIRDMKDCIVSVHHVDLIHTIY